jgi:ATP-dependent helicase/nuclease subunit A
VGKAPLLRPRKADRMSPFAEVMADDEQRDLEEHWRLLYVALTRASEKLVVAGLDTSNKAGALPENCWFTKVEQALHGIGAESVPGGPWGETLSYRGSVASRPVTPKPPAKPLGSPLIPAWAMQPAAPEARRPRPLAPSALAEDRDASPPPSADQRAAARRGTLIHQLFERLPEVELDHRLPAALRWLERSAGIAEASERQELAQLVCAILDHPDFAPLFGPGSLAEAPIAATLEDGRVLAGTVDRLLVEDKRVSVIDFKTGRVPATEAQIPDSHRVQMKAYADALAVIFPGRDVRAALLYTAAPRLFELVP